MLKLPLAAIGSSPRRGGKPAIMNDEVAAILKGLQLDRQFFVSRLKKDALEDLAPQPPSDDRTSDVSPTTADSETPTRRSQRSLTRTKTNALSKNTMKACDFDIFLGEAVLPVVAQAMDALCRQLARMQQQGNNLDPKVRARFNPLTFMAQNIMRLHPKVAKTPRRLAIYRTFSTWSDQEKGRREMLRRKDFVKKVFDGFKTFDKVTNAMQVRRGGLPGVTNAIDETMHLQGVLVGHPEIKKVYPPSAGEGSPCRRSTPTRAYQKQDDVVTFNQFWYDLATIIMQQDVVPWSVIERGMREKQHEDQQKSDEEKAQRRDAEEKDAKEAEQRRLITAYSELYDKLREDDHLKSILEENKILTGDDVRPGDAGYEFEVPPNGRHVGLLRNLLVLVGFEKLASDVGEDASVEEKWWDSELADAWTLLQELHGAELQDGVVEREVLKQVLVPPVGVLSLRSRVEDELEHRADAGKFGFGELDGKDGPEDINFEPAAATSKPTMEQLCMRLGLTMARLQWMHQLFEGYLSDEDPEGSERPVDLYPEDPKSIDKEQMKALMQEVRPDLSDAEFEAKFLRIDADCSGTVEFDEFVVWVREDEIKVVGGQKQHMSLAELAESYDESLGLIERIHEYYQERLPDGVTDDYPSVIKPMEKGNLRLLVQDLNANMKDSEFEAQFTLVDKEGKGHLDFSEFLELIDVDEIPAEIREGTDD